MERLEEDEETGADVDTEGFKCKLIRFSDLAGKLVGHMVSEPGENYKYTCFDIIYFEEEELSLNCHTVDFAQWP